MTRHLEEWTDRRYRPPIKAYDRRRQRPYNVVHWKRDGHYVRIETRGQDGVRVFTKHPTDITSLLDYAPIYDRMCRVPPGYVFLGELWFPGERASYVKSGLKQRRGDAQIDVFALLCSPELGSAEDVHDLSIDEVASIVDDVGLDFAPYWDYSEQPAGARPYLNELCIPDDCEGFVSKIDNLNGWVKFKPVRTIDLVVRGFRDGEGKYCGEVGSLECYTSELYHVASVSGMTDDQRLEMTHDCYDNGARNTVGRVCEVRYQYVGDGGKLRHPAFVQWRDDKTPDECPMSQDPELEEYWTNATS